MILLNFGWMVDLAMSIFEFLTKFLIFWHPWHPWVCIRSDLKPLFETDMSDSSYCVIGFRSEFQSVFQLECLKNFDVFYSIKILAEFRKTSHRFSKPSVWILLYCLKIPIGFLLQFLEQIASAIILHESLHFDQNSNQDANWNA